ncbi:MAG: STAS/SEC14 domain-containing protein [Actinobacteria bacterium]|nr:STAS/SEC14 domain-containing protein [Actinomycetota bacterium]
MIEALNELPAGVVGFRVTGTVTAEDFRDVVIPAVEAAARTSQVRFVVVIPEFHGMTPSALWSDLKIGFENVRSWKRIAVVTDAEWIHHAVALFGWMTPGAVKTFPLAEQAQAVSWVSA